jgi:UDP-N-acetylglucosamine diphosphorylase/glucosamine-1-phosphate N-acetyltransferase
LRASSPRLQAGQDLGKCNPLNEVLNLTDPGARPAPQAVILAAGKGTRMGQIDLPKVLYPVADKPMLWWVVKACQDAGVSRCVIVVGYMADEVRRSLGGFRGVEFVEQTDPKGTAHAAQVTRPLFEDHEATDLFVLAGDGPLIRTKTLARLLEVHRRRKASATLATSVIDDPTGYGRIVRGKDGGLDRIVEQRDATPQQLEIKEVNPSYYCFNSQALFSALDEVKTQNSQGEYYITDVPAILKGHGKRVEVVEAVPSADVLSINTQAQLQEVDAILRRRLACESVQVTSP